MDIRYAALGLVALLDREIVGRQCISSFEFHSEFWKYEVKFKTLFLSTGDL